MRRDFISYRNWHFIVYDDVAPRYWCDLIKEYFNFGFDCFYTYYHADTGRSYCHVLICFGYDMPYYQMLSFTDLLSASDPMPCYDVKAWRDYYCRGALGFDV